MSNLEKIELLQKQLIDVIKDSNKLEKRIDDLKIYFENAIGKMLERIEALETFKEREFDYSLGKNNPELEIKGQKAPSENLRDCVVEPIRYVDSVIHIKQTLRDNRDILKKLIIYVIHLYDNLAHDFPSYTEIIKELQNMKNFTFDPKRSTDYKRGKKEVYEDTIIKLRNICSYAKNENKISWKNIFPFNRLLEMITEMEEQLKQC